MMKRMVVSSAFVLVAIAALSGSALAQRRTSVGFAAGATFPVGDLGDATGNVVSDLRQREHTGVDEKLSAENFVQSAVT